MEAQLFIMVVVEMEKGPILQYQDIISLEDGRKLEQMHQQIEDKVVEMMEDLE
jgi:hypothetical protein